MKKLRDADVIQMMREEWDAKLSALLETVDATLSGKVDGKEKLLLDPNLKLRHKKTQFLYTIVSVSPKDVILKTPEGNQFLVDKVELENSYELD